LNMKKETEKMNKGEIIIYKDKGNKIDLEVKLEKETIWLSLLEISLLFKRDKSVISKHIKNIFEIKELNKNSTVALFATVQKEGNREIKRQIEYYNLDVIISVGYRVNSMAGTQFRIWATKQLKSYLVKGYIINQKRLEEGKLNNLKELEQVLISTKRLLEEQHLDGNEARDVLKVITDYANSWVILQKYDEGKLIISSKAKKVKNNIDYDFADCSINELKKKLIDKGEASDLFGKQRREMLQGILGNLCQSFSGKELYPNVETRAAHLLYFIIKDHPFFDGNKRIASFLFILFLKKNNYLIKKNGERKIDDNGLVALALLVAQSDSKDKEGIIKLIINFLNN